jgi:preprotein translocase subunit SecE
MAKTVVDNSAGASGKAQKTDKAAKAARTSTSAKPAKISATRAQAAKTSPAAVKAPVAPKGPVAAKAPAAVKAPTKETSRLKSLLPRSSSGESRSSASGAPRGAVSTKPHGRVRTFFREVRIEMKKVTWPPRKELWTSTGVVIIAVAVAAIFIGVFDFVWNLIVQAVKLG